VAEEGQVIEALAAIGSVGVVGLAAALVVLAFRALHAKDETAACRDLLDAEQKLSAQYKSERDVAVVNESVASKEHEREQTLRKSVEAELAEVEQRLRTYLAHVLTSASQAVIDATVADLFRRNPSPSVPGPEAEAAPNRTGTDGLINPFDS
jgi:hypothetical protein